MTRPSLGTCIAVMLVGAIVGRSPAHAQPSLPGHATTVAIDGDEKPWNKGVPIATREAARQVFLEGNRLFKIPLFTRAAEQYVAALRQWKHPAFYFNLALTQLNLGQDVEAHEDLKEAMRYGAEPLGAEQFQEAQKQVRELERQLGHLRIRCPTQGAEVTLDGAALFVAPGSYDGWVKPGDHEIAAKRAAYFPRARHVTVAAGTLATLDLPLHKLIADRPLAAWTPWAVVGAGIAIAAAGGAVHVVSARGFAAFDDHFSRQACSLSGCTEEQIGASWNARLDRAKLEQRIAVGGYIAGGAIAAAGAVLLYLNRPRLAEQRDPGSATDIAIVPAASPELLGVVVTVNH